MKGKKVRVDKEDQFVHPNFMPAIINIDDFNMKYRCAERNYSEESPYEYKY